MEPMYCICGYFVRLNHADAKMNSFVSNFLIEMFLFSFKSSNMLSSKVDRTLFINDHFLAFDDRSY